MRAGRNWRAVSILAFSFVFGSCRDQAPVRAASISLSEPALELLIGPSGGQTFQLVAAALDDAGDTLHQVDIRWSVVGEARVSVSSAGLVTALTEGSTSVRAAGGGEEALIAVTVSPVPVDSIVLAFDSLALMVSSLGAQSQLVVATARDSTGAVLVGRTLDWHSSAPSVATVSPTGLIAAVGNGTAIIRAMSGTGGDSVVVNVTAHAGLPPGDDIAITGVWWTQAAQDSSGSVPMIRKGRHAVAIVSTTSTVEVGVPMQFVLRLFDAFGVMTSADTIETPVAAGARSHDESVIQFMIPPSRLTVGMRWEIVRDPRGVHGDLNANNDRYPAVAHAELSVKTPARIRLRFVPVALTGYPLQPQAVDISSATLLLAYFRQFIPHGEFEVTVAPVFGSSADFGLPTASATGAFWSSLMLQLDAARLADSANSDAHWIGVFRPPSGYSNYLATGVGYIPTEGTATGPFTRTLSMMMLQQASLLQLSNLFTHELGHNLGLRHAPCGNAGAPDPNYPDPAGRIGVGSHNTYNWQTGVTTRALRVIGTLGDFMSYCDAGWIGAYNYNKILNFRGEADPALHASSHRQRVLLVQGTVTHDVPSIANISHINAEPSTDELDGAWRLELLDETGAVLLSQRINLGSWSHLEGVRPFGVAVAIDALLESRVRQVRITGPSGQLTTRAVTP
jgi:hypothetical protein